LPRIRVVAEAVRVIIFQMSHLRHWRNYNPDYDALIDWLASPGGNLLWDVLLQALGIFITVFVIQRWIEKREEKRWLPLKNVTYMLLFSTTEKLVRELSPHYHGESRVSIYYFGDRMSASSVPKEFGEKLLTTDSTRFIKRAKEITEQRPDLLSDVYQDLRADVARGSVALAREPELSKLLADLDLALEAAIKAINSPEDSAPKYLAQHFRWVAQSAYKLNKWLKSQADGDSDMSAFMDKLRDGGESRQDRKEIEEAKTPNEPQESEERANDAETS